MSRDRGARSPDRGATVEITIEKAVYGGLGLARHEGQVVFVPHGLPGERVRAEIESARSGYLRARVREVLSPSPARRVSPCPWFPRCGGCAYQDLGLDAQLELKEAVLRESLARAGAAWSGEIPVHSSPESGWRMRCSFHAAVDAAGALVLGLREAESRRVVDVDACLQLSPGLSAALRSARTALGRRPDLAQAVLDLEATESVDGTQRSIAVHTRHAEASQATRLASLLHDVDATGLGLVIGPPQRRRYVGLRGTPTVESSILGVGMRAHVLSFFQGNRFLVEPLARRVVELVPDAERTLDLYAGVGLFALPLARRGGEVQGAELGRAAVEDAEDNARRAVLGNARFTRADVLEALGLWGPATDEAVVLDPPRTGAGRGVVDAIASRRPKAVVYVSCDPPTLGRDLARFAEQGYRPDVVEAFDLFPDTFHLETVVRLQPV